MKKLIILMLSLMLLLMMGCGNSDSNKDKKVDELTSEATVHKDVKEHSVQENDKSAANDVNKPIKESVAAFKRYHKLITEKNYKEAYSLLGHNLQEEMPFNSYSSGYKNTISSVPYEIRVVETGIDKIVLKYDLRAQDRGNNDKTVTNVYSGTCVMIKVNGKWIIDSLEAKVKTK